MKRYLGSTVYYLLNTISAITDRGNNAEVRRKKDGSLTVYEVKKNIVTV